MTRFRTLRSSLPARLVCTAVLCGTLAVPRAFAANKDMIQLQTQVQQLQDAIARLQQSNDERMGVLKDLVQQTADSVNRMSVVVNGLQLRIQNQQDALTAKSDQVSGQIQALNDSVDELKARMLRMEKTLGDVQNQQQSTTAALANLPQPGGAASGPPAGSGLSPTPGPTATPQDSAPSNPQPISGTRPSRTPAAAGGPPAADMYRAAYSDYMAGKYTVASSEFDDLIKAYPDDNLSGNAYFYLGELATRANKPSVAIEDYDHVLERYPDNAKIPAAHLHKGEALLSSKRTEAGVTELRSLIQRFPSSPEASQARTKLSALGVSGTGKRDR